MDTVRRLFVLGVILVTCTGTLAKAQQAPAPATPVLAPEAMEAFLLKAKIVKIKDAGEGVTLSRRATLTDGQLTHDAHVQTVDVASAVFEAGRNTELNFKDTYRYNIAGYRVARLIGIDTVPMSVERNIEGKTAAITWWVDDVAMDEKGRLKNKSGPSPGRASTQIQVMRIFDELIQNRDRNQGNILWTSDGTMWLIDHTRAFRLGKSLLKPEQLTRCDGGLLERLRAMTPESLARAVASSLTKDEQAALLARRDLIVKHYEDRIARLGAPVVVFAH